MRKLNKPNYPQGLFVSLRIYECNWVLSAENINSSTELKRASKSFIFYFRIQFYNIIRYTHSLTCSLLSVTWGIVWNSKRNAAPADSNIKIRTFLFVCFLSLLFLGDFTPRTRDIYKTTKIVDIENPKSPSMTSLVTITKVLED